MTPLLFKSIFRLLSILPLRWLHGLGALLGHITYATSKQYAARTRENLRQSHLAGNEAEFANLLNRTNAEAGKGMVELPWVWLRPFEQVCATVRSCQGWEHVEAAHARGNGIIFLTPHWGCFEITSLYIAQHLTLTNLYSSPKQAWI